MRLFSEHLASYIISSHTYASRVSSFRQRDFFQISRSHVPIKIHALGRQLDIGRYLYLYIYTPICTRVWVDINRFYPLGKLSCAWASTMVDRARDRFGHRRSRYKRKGSTEPLSEGVSEECSR